MKIAVDFDGTCVDQRFPDVGPDVPECVAALLELVNMGHRLMLYTCRTGRWLEPAVRWFIDRGVPLAAIGRDKVVGPYAAKAYADIYVDDMGLGIPLWRPEGFRHNCVNWTLAMMMIQAIDPDTRYIWTPGT